METSLFIGIGILVVLTLIVLLVSYVKSPPSTAFIISGLLKNPKVLVGTGGIRIPFFQRLDKVYLGQITVDIKTVSPIPTKDFINVRVDAVSKVRVLPTPDGIRLASKNFLNMSPEDISNQVQDSLQGNMREIVGEIELKELNTNRDQFSNKIEEKAKDDMAKLGLEIISCNIQEITDTSGLISDLGADNTMKIKADAAKIKAEKEAEIAITQAEQKKKSNDARVLADKEIAIKNNELALKILDLQKVEGTQKAISAAAYEIEGQIQKKEIYVKTVDADIARTERQGELTQKEILLEQHRLTAEVNKKADAEKYKIQVEAEAKLEQEKREAEAARYKVEQEAIAQKAKADALAYAKEQEAIGLRKIAEALAFEIEAKGKAEAEAIEAKGKAEAEAMEKKAEAFAKYDSAAKMEMIINVLPEVAKHVAAPMSAINSLNIYGTDASGASKLSGQVPVMIKQVMDTVSDATGVDMSDIVKSNTIAAKTDKNINIDGGLELEKEIVKQK